MDIRNDTQIIKIRHLLIDYPLELALFELICILCNERLNQPDIKNDILKLSILEETDDELDSDYIPDGSSSDD